MNKVKNFCTLIILVFFLTAINIDNRSFTVNSVKAVVNPTNETEIVIGIDLGHNNNITSKELTNLTTILNSTFSSGGVVFIRNELTSVQLREIDVLAILSPKSVYTEDEVEVIEEYIKTGKSILTATGFRNQTNEPLNNLMSQFGLHFNLSSSIIRESSRTHIENQSVHYYDLVRNFTTPPTPITENISQIMFPQGLGLSFNSSKLTSYHSPAITYYNPILIRDALSAPSENNTLISSLEFENGARILAIGSSDMFNNSFIEPLVNTTTIFMDNTDLVLNSIKWLGRNTGIMHFYESSVSQNNREVKIGEILYGNITLVNSRNKSLSQGQVYFSLERDGKILNSRSMRTDPNNSTRYLGWTSTDGLSYGFCDIVFIAKRIGYLPIELTAGRLYIESAFPYPQLPNLAMWGLLFAAVIIFISSAVVIRLNFKN